MAAISTGNHPAALWPGVQAWFGNTYNDFSEEYPELFEVLSSTRAYEEDIVTKPFGLAPVKEQGAATAYTSHSQGFTKRYTHVAYALGFITTREEMDDNLYAEIGKKRAPMLARSMRKTVETVAANIYNRFTTAGFTGGDGVVLGSTAHPTASGNQSNILSTAADFSEAAYEDIIVQIMGATDEAGLSINLMPKGLIVPRQLIFEATRVVKSVQQNDNANNAINAGRVLGLFDTPKVNHYLTDSDQWFVRTDCPDSMKFLWRKKAELSQDNDGDTMNAKTKSYMRFVCGWSDWRGVYGSPGA